MKRRIKMDILVTSSTITLSWLKTIRDDIEKKFSHTIKYKESKYWASFQNTRTNRNVASLQPQKSQIRLLLRLIPSYYYHLKESPCSGGWAKHYPSIFVVKSENMIKKAVELIISSYEYDLKI